MNAQEIDLFDFDYSLFSTQDRIHQASLLPIHNFYNEIPNGKVLDVGYEFGGLAMYYASRGRQVYAFDKEPHHELRLKERIANEEWRDKIVLSRGILPKDSLPAQKFSIISICSVLHFFEFPIIKQLIGQLTDLLIPGGWIMTQNHHKSHLYGVNPKHVGPSGYYKHFFSSDDIKLLFPENIFNEKYLSIETKYYTHKEITANNYRFNAWGYNTEESRRKLKTQSIDIPYHTDIYTVHEKG